MNKLLFNEESRYATFSDNWKQLGKSIICFKTKTMDLHPNIIFVNFNAIIDVDNNRIDTSILRKIKTYKEYSVVIYDNAVKSFRDINVVKFWIEKLSNYLEFISLFPTKKNKFYIPHTGTFKFVKALYNQKEINVNRTIIMSLTNRDIMYAHNCGMETININEGKKTKPKNSVPSDIINTQTRLEILNILKEKKNIELSEVVEGKYIDFVDSKNADEEIVVPQCIRKRGFADFIVFMIYGPPSGGKTFYIMNQIEKLSNTPFNETRLIEHMHIYNTKKSINDFEKKLRNRICLFCEMHGIYTNDERARFENVANQYGATVLYIEVNPGYALSQVLNHYAVETSDNEDLELHKVDEYTKYRTKIENAKEKIRIYPQIEKSKILTDYLYCS